MRQQIVGLGIGIGLTLVACGASELLGPDAPQGIDGLVLIGPMCPVFTVDDPCPDQPYQAWIEIRTDAGAHVTRVRTDEEGRFRVGLRAGSYLVDPEAAGSRMILTMASEQTVEVEAGVYTEVIVTFDSGIR